MGKVVYPLINSTTIRTAIQSHSTQLTTLSLASPESSQQRLPLPCHVKLPRRDPEFADRTDILSEIETALCPKCYKKYPSSEERTGIKSFALCGAGGIGKTAVATEFAWAHSKCFDAIFWLHAEEPTSLASMFSRIAIELGLLSEASQEAKDTTLTRNHVLNWLSRPRRSILLTEDTGHVPTWLLVFDNVSDGEVLRDYWPDSSINGSILLTSRDPLAKTPFYQCDGGVDLTPFTTHDAAEFLLKISWRVGDNQERQMSHVVTERLGCYPLALKQMAGVIIRQHLSFEEFIKRYDEEETHNALLKLSFNRNHEIETYNHTLASVWALEDLKTSGVLMQVIAFLDPDEIPEQLLEEVAGKLNLEGYPRNITSYHEARSELLTSSLISRNFSTKSISVHRLIQDACRAKMSTERFRIIFNATVELITFVWPSAGFGIRHNVSRWALCEVLARHLLRLLDRFSRQNKTIQEGLAENLNFSNIINELGWYGIFQAISLIILAWGGGKC